MRFPLRQKEKKRKNRTKSAIWNILTGRFCAQVEMEIRRRKAFEIKWFYFRRDEKQEI